MRTFTAGKITLELSDPWPMWVTIKLLDGDEERNEVLRGFSHTALVDLKHVVERAIAEVERRCPGETA